MDRTDTVVVDVNVATMAAKTVESLWMLEYRIKGDTLEFVVITEPASVQGITSGHLTYWADSSSPGLRDLGVRKPDGSGTIPLTRQLYQVTPYEVLFTDSQVSTSTFLKLIESRTEIAQLIQASRTRALQAVKAFVEHCQREPSPLPWIRKH